MNTSRRQHRHSFNEPGHAHELTFGCYRGYSFLSRERTCLWLADAVRSACDALGYSLWAYVFMPNHVHLIVHPNQPQYLIAELLKAIKLPVSRRALSYLREQDSPWLERIKTMRGQREEYHFWQRGGGYDRNIIEPKTLARMIEYVHLNPVRKGLTERTIDSKWSSAGWFEGQQPNGLAPDRIPVEWTSAVPD